VPIGGESEIAGGYTVTWNSVALGIFQGEQDVPSIIRVPKSRPVNSTDRYGQSKIDSVHLGHDFMFEGVLMEYPKALPLLQMIETVWGRLGTIGALKFSAAQPLVLTAIAGTTASTAPATVTASKAVWSDDHPTRLFYGPQLRVVPVRLDLLPYLAGGVPACLTET
jgi:hypothetical protein